MRAWNERLGPNDVCPICVLPLGEDEASIAVGHCLPIAHRCHVACWNGQPEHMKPFCRVCSQQSLGEEDLFLIGGLFGMEDILDVAEYPPLARRMLERFVTGAVSQRQLWRWGDACSTRRACGQLPLEG